MVVSVDVAGKLVIINTVFRDRFGSVVDAPADATYEWSVTEGGEFVTVEGTGDNNEVGRVTPVAPGTAIISLTVSRGGLEESPLIVPGGGLNSPLTGTLEVRVLAMEPVSVELNGTVIDAA